MEQIELMVLKMIYNTSKMEVAKKLGIDHRTLDSRIKKGNWSNEERELIKELYDRL